MIFIDLKEFISPSLVRSCLCIDSIVIDMILFGFCLKVNRTAITDCLFYFVCTIWVFNVLGFQFGIVHTIRIESNRIDRLDYGLSIYLDGEAVADCFITNNSDNNKHKTWCVRAFFSLSFLFLIHK